MRPRRPRAPAAEAGFTLLEILVALVVLGFLLLGLAEGVRFGLRAWDSETKLVDRRADMDGMERVLRGLVNEADPGDFNEPTPFHGKPHTLALVSRLPMAASALVTRNADVGLGVDAKHRLVLRWSLRPHAERLTKPEKPQETVLLEGVEDIAFSYLRGADQGGGWVDTWELPTLPLLVRITIGFPKDDRRHWPAIEAAPLLSRGEQ
jgi:general secretion pathway protein J